MLASDDGDVRSCLVATLGDRARRAFESHLSRAKWMTEHGYRLLLRGGAPAQSDPATATSHCTVSRLQPRRLSEFGELPAVWLSYRRQNRYPDQRTRWDR